MYINLICHNTIITKLNRFMESKAINNIERFLYFKLHDDFIKMQDLILIFLLFLILYLLNIIVNRLSRFRLFSSHTFFYW